MNWPSVFSAVLTHLQITFFGVLLGCVIGLPMAVLLIQKPKLSHSVFAVIDLVQTVPTLAMLIFVMLLLGLNNRTVVVSIALFSLFPIIRNAYVGLNSVDRGTLRAAKGIGMTQLQVFTKVRIPIAAPMILAGIRLAVVSALSIATTGVFIGAGGLGMLVWCGIQTRNTAMMLSGAVPISMLALMLEYFIERIEKKLTYYK